MTSKKILHMAKGQSLLEIIIAGTVFSLLAAAIAFMFTHALVIYRKSDDKKETMQDAQIAKEWLMRDLGSASCISQANTESLEIINDQGRINYFLENPQSPFNLTRSVNTVDYLLGENIDSLSFKYFDASNQETTTDIQVVETTLAARSGDQLFDLYAVAPVYSMEYCTGANAYGGGNDDYLSDSEQTIDGGYVMLGYTTSFVAVNTDILLIKLSAIGDVQWAKIYGGADLEHGKRILVLSDGYLIAAETKSGFSGLNKGTLLIRTDINGDIVWYNIYGNTSNHQHFVRGLKETGDGYIVAGYDLKDTNEYNLFVLKVDKDTGAILYDNTMIDAADQIVDYCMQDLQEAVDGNFLIVGTTDCWAANPNNVFLIKFNPSSGAVVFHRSYDSGSTRDSGWSVSQDPLGGYLIGGMRSALMVIKTTDDTGSVIDWANTYTAGQMYSFQSITGGYFIQGRDSAFPYDSLLIKTDSSGNDVWKKNYGGESCDDAGKRLFILQGHPTYVAAGDTACYGAGGRDFVLFKTDFDGDIGNCTSFVRNASVSSTPLAVNVLSGQGQIVGDIGTDIILQSPQAIITATEVSTVEKSIICQ